MEDEKLMNCCCCDDCEFKEEEFPTGLFHGPGLPKRIEVKESEKPKDS